MSLELSSKENPPYAVKGVCDIMGTYVTIIAVSHDSGRAQKAIGKAFQEIFKINDLMSVYREESEISRLNRDGFHNNISSDTLYVIKRAKYYSELTDGAFDITLLPVLKVWESHAKKNHSPTESLLKEKLNHVGCKNIEINGRHIRFVKNNMAITLAGIAKGYAVDKAIETLRRNRISHALVNGGGDIRVLGGKTSTLPWKIGILDPKDKTKVYTTVELNNQAIATSGTYQRFFNDIIDPRGGRPAQDIISSTVITEKAMDADVLATASMIMGSENGSRLLDNFKEAQAFYINNEGQLIRIYSKG